MINAGANMIGASIIGVLNLLTPTEFFKLWRDYFIYDGWIYIILMYPFVVVIGAGLQYIAQRPLKLYLDDQNPEALNKSKSGLRARRRLLILPATISLLNISMWTGLSLMDASWMVIAKLIPSLQASPLYSHSWHTVYFTLFRGIVIGCLAAGLAFLLVETYSRKHLIPITAVRVII